MGSTQVAHALDIELLGLLAELSPAGAAIDRLDLVAAVSTVDGVPAAEVEAALDRLEAEGLLVTLIGPATQDERDLSERGRAQLEVTAAAALALEQHSSAS